MKQDRKKHLGEEPEKQWRLWESFSWRAYMLCFSQSGSRLHLYLGFGLFSSPAYSQKCSSLCHKLCGSWSEAEMLNFTLICQERAA